MARREQTRHLKRVDLDAPGPRRITGRGLEPVYVIAHDQEEARAWAQRNKPGRAVKFAHTALALAARGLYLKDEPVYVLRPPLPEVRDAWLRTGAHLVYL